MDEKEYISGCQLRQYLHISTRKLKYFMDNNIIPHENTGQTTHKYRVRMDDAREFKYRMESEVGFLSEFTGQFSSRPKSLQQPKPLIEVNNETCKAFRVWLTKEWSDLPDALPTKIAAKLIGSAPQRLHELIRRGEILGIKIGSVQFCQKNAFIAYVSSPEKLARPTNETYKELIRAFKKRQCRVRESEKKRMRRNSS